LILVLIGVAGCGKTTVGKRLAADLGWTFLDADDFHSAANVAKMAAGEALSDEDRWPWLALIRQRMIEDNAASLNTVWACSALKRSYRDFLLGSGGFVRCVYLRGNYTLLLARIRSRSGHYMKEQMLASQFESLEEPEDCLVVDVSATPEEIAATIRARLALN
jgi:gluconokinase